MTHSKKAYRCPLLLLTTLCAGIANAAGIPDAGLNCKVDKPPGEAGEFLTQGIEGRVFPKLGSLPKSYTGCQTAWSENPGGWQIVARVYFEKGLPSVLSTPDAATYRGMVCHYARGALVSGSPEDCFPYERLKMKSFPKHCAALFRKSGKAPPECVEDGGP